MARQIHLNPHLSIDELVTRYRSTKDPVERSRWHFLWLLTRGLTAKVIVGMTGYSAYWIGRIAQRYNEHRPDGVKDRRHQARPSRQLLTTEQQAALFSAVGGPAPQHERWTGRMVAEWIAHRLERPVCRQVGRAYLRRLGARLLAPRPRHVHTNPQAQATFKQHLRPLLREVATAFPRARVELWAVDEHRIGLKPILRKVWTLAGHRPIAPVEHQMASASLLQEGGPRTAFDAINPFPSQTSSRVGRGVGFGLLTFPAFYSTTVLGDRV